MEEKIINDYARKNGFNSIENLFDQTERHLYALGVVDESSFELPIGLPIIVEIKNGGIERLSPKEALGILSLLEE